MPEQFYSTKDGSALVFMREFADGTQKTLKYDFKDSNFYTETRKGNWRLLKNGANSTQSFFKGLTRSDVKNSFDNPDYREFLDIVIKGSPDSYSNIGSMLQYIPKFQHMESWVLQKDINFDKPNITKYKATRSYWRSSRTEGGETYYGIKKPVNIYQKDVLMFMKELSLHNRNMKAIYGEGDRYGGGYDHKVSFGSDWEDKYLSEYRQKHIINLCTFVRANYHGDWEVYEWVYDLITGAGNYRAFQEFLDLSSTYKLEYKALLNYLIEIDRREGIPINSSVGLLGDYLSMSTELRNNKVVKYPKLLKLRHDIATRNYEYIRELKAIEDAEQRRLARQTEEENKVPTEDAFKRFINYDLDWMNKTHAVVSPLNSQEMAEEGNKLSHCVANYVRKVIQGTCQVMFLRDLKDGNEPLITLEVRHNAIVQVRGYDNRDPSPEEIEILTKFAKAKRLDYAQGGYDATEDREKDKLKQERQNYDEQNKQDSDEGITQEISLEIEGGEDLIAQEVGNDIEEARGQNREGTAEEAGRENRGEANREANRQEGIALPEVQGNPETYGGFGYCEVPAPLQRQVGV